jgi:organic radical activating enzyme
MSPTGLRTKVAAPLLEVFASLQGEGAYVGEPQVLVRLRGCPLRCRWCDTPGSWTLDAGARAHGRDDLAPAGDRTRPDPGWATPFQAACRVAEVEPGTPRTVSVTGGEPLMWPDFVLGLRDVLGPRRLHLETAGGHPDALERVLPVCDHVSLDLKLPADLGPPVPLRIPSGVEDAPARFERSPRDAQDWRAARARDLALLRGRDAALKLVVAGGRRAEEFEELLADAARLAGELPLVVQPVSPRAGVEAPSAALLADVVELARELRLAVRVVPQVHRLLGLP